MSGVGGIVAVGASIFFYVYRGQGGTIPLVVVLGIIGLGLLGYAGNCIAKARQVTSVAEKCPYCGANNRLLENPNDDFTCIECHRLIPVLDGNILPVRQVRCGFCNELNYYSDKTEVLLCETCNHEIPIAQEEGHVSKKLAPGYAVKDDDRPYELVLVATGPKTEELVSTLQQMLALNRNQVKQMLTETPITLLQGIPKKKAEMLRAQLAIHDAAADARPM
ncbi:MAG: hypothetical protein ACOYON_09895 [Fimbriimonas sp.]